MANILDKITNFSFLKKGGSVLGVDIGTSAIKIVQIKNQGGKVVLENYGALALGPYANLEPGQAAGLSKEKIIEAINDLIREASITAKNSGISIPLKDTMISLIEMPDVGEKQLKTMIPIEARKHIPVPMSEVTLNFWVMPHEDSLRVPTPTKETQKKQPKNNEVVNNVEVLIAAIHNNSINKYQKIKESVGFEARLFEIEIFSTIRSLVGSDMSTVMIIDIGAAATKTAMVDNGILRGSHIINRGSQDITIALSKSFGISIGEAEKIKRKPTVLDEDSRKRFSEVVSLPLSHIFLEANSVLLDYQKKYNKAVSKVILSGGGVLLHGLSELAKENFKIEVVIGDPFVRMEAPVFLRETLKKTGPEFAVAIGLALEAL